ncbi:MAG: peptide ABC transporter substrate-binding protein [Pyramidobacter sp.]|jgi:oligopeptide transport system substrate-binding protein
MKGGFWKKAAAAAAFAAMAASVSCAAETKEYRTVYSDELTTLNYLKGVTTPVIQLSQNIVDGLVEFDRYGLIMPSLATDWTVSDDHRTYTFHIRKGVNWYTCEGKEYAPVTAHDFEAALKWELNKKNASAIVNTVYENIEGAEDYYLGKNADWNSVGVKVPDDYTIQYTFVKPVPYALRLFAYGSFYPVCQKFLDETGEDFGTSNDTLLYCGAYILSTYEPEYQRILTVNEHYWNRKEIHIDRIVYKYNKEASANSPELFLRGEVMEVVLPGTIMDDWMKDSEKKKLIHPHVITNGTYFMCLNFEPDYDEKYDPKNWLEAVNSLNFRKALFHGLDRIAALMVIAPYDFQRRKTGTLTRRNLVQYRGVDYTMMGGLKAYTEGESFNPELAVEYRKKAMEELKGRVNFPVKVVFPYNTGTVDNANQAQVIGQQMEKLLGKDFIDIVLVPYPPSGYNQTVRDPGRYSIIRFGWGPDYADPLSAFDPMMKSGVASKWSRIYLARDYLLPDGRGKFEAMADKAAEEVIDVKKRYELFAEAETFLLDNAFIIPLYMSGGGFEASYIDPFSGFTTQWGDNSSRKLKGARLLDHPMGMEEYAEAEKKYLAECDEARRNAKYE